MKRAERHHLKENELQTIARDLRGRYEERRKETTAVLVVAAVVAVAAIGFFAWRERVQTRAATLLAEATAVKDARIGLAEAQAAQGQYEQAINTFKELAQRKEGPLPVDGILMQLGRTYLVAGKRADAQQTFNRLVEEFPDSPYTSDARRELDTLKKT